GVPAHLGAELRLLNDVGSTLPVPVPSGVDSTSTTVNGSAAVVLSDPSKTVSAVVWEDAQHEVNIVAGLLDERDVLPVAQQIGGGCEPCRPGQHDDRASPRQPHRNVLAGSPYDRSSKGVPADDGARGPLDDGEPR